MPTIEGWLNLMHATARYANRLCWILLITHFVISSSYGQTQSGSGTSGSETVDQNANSTGSTNGSTSSQEKSSQRIFGVVPAFNVTDAKTLPALSSRQKFALAAQEIYDPFTFAAAGFEAGISQAQNQSPSYGQGLQGYGKRFGASFGDQISQSFFDTYLLPTALHQDPRYYRLGKGAASDRLRYSLSRVVLTRTDTGHKAFNWSKVGGSLLSGALSNAYYPENDRGIGLTLENAAINLGATAAFNALAEFWPDIQNKLRWKRSINDCSSGAFASPSVPGAAR